jgi:hypothetical protein
MTRTYKPMRPLKSTSDWGDYLSVNIDPSNNSVREPTGQPARILPFPVGRRSAFINRAFVAADEFPDGGNEYKRSIMQRHRARLEKLGVAPELIQAEVNELADMFFGDQSEQAAS